MASVQCFLQNITAPQYGYTSHMKNNWDSVCVCLYGVDRLNQLPPNTTLTPSDTIHRKLLYWGSESVRPPSQHAASNITILTSAITVHTRTNTPLYHYMCSCEYIDSESSSWLSDTSKVYGMCEDMDDLYTTSKVRYADRVKDKEFLEKYLNPNTDKYDYSITIKSPMYAISNYPRISMLLQTVQSITNLGQPVKVKIIIINMHMTLRKGILTTLSSTDKYYLANLHTYNDIDNGRGRNEYNGSYFNYIRNYPHYMPMIEHIKNFSSNVFAPSQYSSVLRMSETVTPHEYKRGLLTPLDITYVASYLKYQYNPSFIDEIEQMHIMIPLYKILYIFRDYESCRYDLRYEYPHNPIDTLYLCILFDRLDLVH